MLMNLKILLPYKIFADLSNIANISAETINGSFGILPRRLDCMAALTPGILTYKTADNTTNYIAIDEGILVKTNYLVFVSVRNAIAGTSLDKLRESVEKDFKNLNEIEKSARISLAKLENGFITSFEKLKRN